MHRTIRRWGLTWRIPYNIFEQTIEDDIGGKYVEAVPYMSPVEFFTHLMERTPDLVMGGSPDFDVGRSFLQSFWQQYRLFHPSHRIYHYYPNPEDWSSIVPMCFHGDEGRGLKKGQTCVMMLETCIGLDSYANAMKKNGRVILVTAMLGSPLPKEADQLHSKETDQNTQLAIVTLWCPTSSTMPF